MYLEKDIARGVDGTFMWLMEEVGELAAAFREGTREEQAAEFADVLAWLTTIANVVGVDLAAAVLRNMAAAVPGVASWSAGATMRKSRSGFLAMQRRSIASRLIQLMLILVVLRGTAAAMSAPDRQASGDGPKITGCRIGFDDQFKVGYWTPIWVDVSSASGASKLSIEVTTYDSDGVTTTTTVPAVRDGEQSSSASSENDAVATAPLYVKVGRSSSAIHFALLEGDKALDRRDIECQLFADSSHAASLRATSEVVVQIGAAAVGLRDALPDHDLSQGSSRGTYWTSITSTACRPIGTATKGSTCWCCQRPIWSFASSWQRMSGESPRLNAGWSWAVGWSSVAAAMRRS